MKKLSILLFSLSLLWTPIGFADELDKEAIEEMKILFVEECKADTEYMKGQPIAKCECFFDHHIDAELSEEELLWYAIATSYRKSKGIPESQFSDEKQIELLPLIYSGMAACDMQPIFKD